MRNALLVLLLTLTVVSCSSGNKYVIKGKIEGLESGLVTLQKYENSEWVKVDSATMEDGKFEITGGMVDYPEPYYLMIEGARAYAMFYLENKVIRVTAHIDSLFYAEIEGSETQDVYNEFSKGVSSFSEGLAALNREAVEANESGDEAQVASIMSRSEELYEELNDYQLSFIKDHASSYASPYILSSISYSMDVFELEEILNNFDDDVKASPVVARMYESVEGKKKVAIGQTAPGFTQNDQDGNPVSLSDMLGSGYLLVDFWAAWCGPCRNENPNVVEVYNDYHDKGFNILGVSLDSDREDWLKAIEDDGLSWTHVSDLQYWNNEVARLYAVNSIPANFLLDAEGKIVATGLRGDGLREKIAELLAD